LLHCNWDTSVYDELIIPLLYLLVWGKKTFVDGNDLKTNIMNYMPRLNKFTFNICSSNHFYNQINLPSNEDIQHTFRDFKNNQIISCVDYFQQRKYRQCHIYSYPYKLEQYNDIKNNFPGGIFRCTCEVSLFDERPFEHEFFLRLAQPFPLMEKLTLINRKRQNNKRFRQSKNEN
jgi:hypothetical protein